jgi:hypothetical protein
MNTIGKTLDKIAENILCMDEASLDNLWNKYKGKWNNFLSHLSGKNQL